MQDTDYMTLAMSLARATSGQTSPNPQVGAVLVKDGCIVGTGAHLQAGTPHAERHAIDEAGERARGATLYVTLEPCSHTGRTGPCTEAIIAAGIAHVFVASTDPNPVVSGNGITALRQAGIDVETGLMAQEAADMNEAFFHFIKTGTPYVTLKSAVSLDGKTATKTGDSQWITAPESRQDVHRLRHEHDAILTGIETIIHDNPQLTTRLPRGGKHPIRVILDTHLRIPKDATVITDEAVQTIIYTGNTIDADAVASYQDASVEIVTLPTSDIQPADVLADLGRRQVLSVLIEGGSGMHAAFSQARLFQQMIVYVAPRLIGGTDALPMIGGAGIDEMTAARDLTFTHMESIGPDIKMIAKPVSKA